MPRRERRSVGADVLREANALSNRLLEQEHACFARQEVLWKQGGSDLARDLMKVLARTGPTAALRDGVLVKKTVAAALDVSLKAANQAFALLDTAGQDALDTIRRELVMCESTLAKKYEGVAQVGADSVDLVQLGKDARSTYSGRMDVMLFRFEQSVRSTLVAADAGKESSALILARLLSADPVKLPGQPGRGVWWGNLSDCQAAAREAEIRMTDRIRLTAMDGMNKAGASRGR